MTEIELPAPSSAPRLENHLPEHMCIETAFILTAGVNAGIIGESEAADFVFGKGGYDTDDLRQFCAAFSCRAAIWYAHDCGGYGITAKNLRARVRAARAETILADIYAKEQKAAAEAREDEAERVLKEFLRDTPAGAHSAGFRLEHGHMPGLPEGELPIRIQRTSRLACLSLGAITPEGDLAEHISDIYHLWKLERPADARQIVREKMREAAELSKAVIAGTYEPAVPSHKVRDGANASSIICPYCFYQWAATKSWFMGLGVNHGGGGCQACGMWMELRAYDDEGELDCEGKELRAFRMGEAPDETTVDAVSSE